MAERETTVKLTVADNFSQQLRAFATALDQSQKSVDKTKQKFDLFGKANEQLTSGIKSGLTLAVASVPAVMGAAGLAAIKLGMDMEQTRTAFTQLTGSADAANKHLQDLRDFAKSTPFQFTELTEASKKMQAFGFATKDVIPMLTDIGDATSALGAGSEGIESVTRALGQMQAKGKVSAEEMNQLTEVGINGWKYLSEGIGKSTAEVMKMSQQGLIPAGDAIQYILKGMRQDFGGGMAAQSKTAAGQISNLVDSLEEMGTTIGEIILPALKDLIKGLTDFFSTLRDGIKTGDMLIKWNNRLQDAFTATEKKIRSTAQSYDEYKKATLAVADAAGLLNKNQSTYADTLNNGLDPSVKMMTESEWAADRALQSRNATTEAYVKQLGARMAADQAATAALQEHSAIMSEAQLGMLALSQATQQGGKAQEEYKKWVEESAKAEQATKEQIDLSIVSYNNLAQSLMKATDAQAKQALASAALATLKQAADDGTISQTDFAKATEQVMLRYDLATPKSIAMADAQKAVDDAFIAGDLPIANYIAAAEKIPKIASDGKVSLDELRSLGISPTTTAVSQQKDEVNRLKDAWAKIPKLVTTTYKIVTEGTAPSGAQPANIPGKASGGPVQAGGVYRVGERGPETLVMGRNGGGMIIPNNNTNYFNMSVYTNDAASPIREFGLLQALAGAQ